MSLNLQAYFMVMSMCSGRAQWQLPNVLAVTVHYLDPGEWWEGRANGNCPTRKAPTDLLEKASEGHFTRGFEFH